MIVLVCGGRKYHDYEHVEATLNELTGAYGIGDVVIVNGGAAGADQLATRWAKEHGARFAEIPVASDPYDAVAKNTPFDWVTCGKKAGVLRNAFLLDTFKPTHGVVFPGGNGTLDMLTRLFHAGVWTWVVGPRR